MSTSRIRWRASSIWPADSLLKAALILTTPGDRFRSYICGGPRPFNIGIAIKVRIVGNDDYGFIYGRGREMRGEELDLFHGPIKSHFNVEHGVELVDQALIGRIDVLEMFNLRFRIPERLL